jgi:hypothetical protein
LSAQTDFWGDIAPSAVRTPLAIMREQAALLGKKTKNLVEAEVRTTAKGIRFEHVFNLVVPSFDDYRYQLFVAEHGPHLYPASVLDSNDSKQEAKDEQQFTDWLRNKLSSAETRTLVSNSLAQVSG